MYVRELYKAIETIIPTMTVTNWANFTNQPDGDGLEILSNSAADVGKCTIWGSDKTTGLLCQETVTLTGTSVMSTAKLNWDDIYGVFLGDANGKNITPAVGTITVREASNNATVTTLTAALIQKGMLILHLNGKNVEIAYTSGKIYVNTVERATSANGLYNVGTSAGGFSMRVKDKLYIISDDTGCALQVVILED
jgi:hypothetical protein